MGDYNYFFFVIGLREIGGVSFAHLAPLCSCRSPYPVSALLSPAMIGIGAYGLLRLWLELMTGNYTQYSLYINIWGLATMILWWRDGADAGRHQKVLAYSSISQMGYILFGIGSESILGISGERLFMLHMGSGRRFFS